MLEPSALSHRSPSSCLSAAVLGQFHPLVWLSWLLFAAVSYFLLSHPSGLVLRAIGESPGSACDRLQGGRFAIWRPCLAARWRASAVPTSHCLYVALDRRTGCRPRLDRGRPRRLRHMAPGRCLLGAYLFGGVDDRCSFFAQGAGARVPTELMLALPYLRPSSSSS